MKYKFEVIVGMDVEIEAKSFHEAETLAKTDWISYVQQAWVESCNRIPENERSLRDDPNRR